MASGRVCWRKLVKGPPLIELNPTVLDDDVDLRIDLVKSLPIHLLYSFLSFCKQRRLFAILALGTYIRGIFGNHK